MKWATLGTRSKLAILFVGVAGLTTMAHAQDFNPTEVAEVAPDHVEVLFEDEHTALMAVRLAPGESLPEHDGGHRVIYSLSEYVITMTKGDTRHTQLWKEGMVHWHDSGRHAIENTGTTEARFLVAVCKVLGHEEGPANLEGAALSAVAPEATRVILENDDAQVTEVRVPAGGTLPEHGGYYRVIYSQTPYSVTLTVDNGEQESGTFEAGDVHAHEASKHSLENTGDTDAEFLIFAWKR